MENIDLGMQKSIIPFKFHPRVFNSLGADLVTDDIVAIIELVKNAYDAGADKVIISFLKEHQKTKHDEEITVLEIFDNGHGMDRKTIENVWFTVATPYKENYKTVKKNTDRIITGEKGLGRLSTARLGRYLEMYTMSENEPCWKVSVDWNDVSGSDPDNPIGGIIEEGEFPYSDNKSGTVLRIANLHSKWFAKKEDGEDYFKQEENKLETLENNLSRFISPFSNIKKMGNFQIVIKNPISQLEVQIKTPSFLDHPVYSIKGEVTENGNISYLYNYDDGDRKN